MKSNQYLNLEKNFTITDFQNFECIFGELIKKENEEYIIMLSNTLNKNSYKVRINAKTGDVIEWEEMIQQKP